MHWLISSCNNWKIGRDFFHYSLLRVYNNSNFQVHIDNKKVKPDPDLPTSNLENDEPIKCFQHLVPKRELEIWIVNFTWDTE